MRLLDEDVLSATVVGTSGTGAPCGDVPASTTVLWTVTGAADAAPADGVRYVVRAAGSGSQLVRVACTGGTDGPDDVVAGWPSGAAEVSCAPDPACSGAGTLTVTLPADPAVPGSGLSVVVSRRTT